MVKHLLILLLMLFAIPMAMAQNPPVCPSDNTPAADNCPDACIYCNLESYTGSTVGYSQGSAPGFCGTIEGEQWLGFVAGADNATVSVVPSNCAIGNGVQVAIYQNCSGTPIPFGCDMGSNGGGNDPVSVTVSLTPGTVYYLMVDGWAGDQCDFTISVSPPGAAIGAQFIEEDIQFCQGDTVVLGGMIFTEPGTYQEIIPSMNGNCDTVKVYHLSYLPYATTTQYIQLNYGESVNIDGIDYFAPDVVESLVPANSGCDSLITYILILDASVPDTCSESRSFYKLFGEPNASERGQVLCPSSDGNFYIAGEKGSTSLLMKVSSDGDVFWSRTFQPVPPLTAHITDLTEDSEGMLAGSAIVGDGTTNLITYAFRYNPVADNFIWSRLIEPQSPESFAIIENGPGGNFLLLVSPQLALNVDDAEIWELSRASGALIGGQKDRYNLGASDLWSNIILHDGSLYVVGRHIPLNQFAPIPLDKMRVGVSKINPVSGAPVWTRLSHIAVAESATLFGQDLLVHDNTLVSVYNGNDSGDPDASPAMFMQKHTLDGDLLWVKRFDTPVPSGLLASDVQQMSDGYAIVGLAFEDGEWEKIVVKTDFDGNLIWSRKVANTSVANTANALNLGQHQAEVLNNTLYLTATTENTPTDVVLVKITSNGEISDSCNLVEPFVIVAEAVPNPVNTTVVLPFTQFTGNLSNKTVATQSTPMLLETYCIRCAEQLVCDDTLDLGPDIVLCKDSTVTFTAAGNFVNYLWQDGSTNPTFTTNAYGIYWVEVTDECGDKQRDTVLLTVSLVGDVKLKDTTLCIGGSLTVSVPGFDTYDWSPSAGLSCDNCETVTIQPVVTTTYSLYAENADGCTKNDTFTVVVLPLQTYTSAIAFCPGESVTIGGTTYTQSGTVIDTIPGTVGCDTIVTYNLTLLPYNTAGQAIAFCPGESVTIGGVTYTQSGTVIDTIAAATGCDTIVTYTLTLLPYNTKAQTIAFCPGESVSIGGATYTQSGTVIDTIPATTGCDTIATYTLILLPQPTLSATIEFCNGESVTIAGNVYTQPGTVVATLPAATGCDTIATYTLKLIDTPNSSVSIDCPADIDIAVDPGAGPVAVNYNLPAVSSDCECPGIELVRTQGFASGSLFPIGLTTVCYQAKDSCGNTATCCFDVFVREESACDIKTIGCMKWELLDITKNTENELTYRIRVTNNCANKLIYTAIQVPDGQVAVAPANNSVFTAPSGRQYDVRSPNFSPFYSVRFKSQTDSIANGQSDIFKYRLPGQTMPAYIHVNARLAPQLFFEAHLNTFYCPIGVTPGDDRPADRKQAAGNLPALKVFPNPTSGALYADFSDWQGEEIKVQVFNSQGQRLRLLNIQAADTPQQVLESEGLPDGLYFLDVLRTNGEKETVRFVIQH